MTKNILRVCVIATELCSGTNLPKHVKPVTSDARHGLQHRPVALIARLHQQSHDAGSCIYAQMATTIMIQLTVLPVLINS